jgi:GNAT superfamily N-acetyltransferase
MSIHVTEYRDPNEAYERALGYLISRPADHNLLHTILDQAREFALGGRFWIVTDGEHTAGFALQSPPDKRVVLGRMSGDAIRALADAIDPPIPGVQGDAAGAAMFAGHFAARHRVPVADVEARRLYELGQLGEMAGAPGNARPATASDRLILADWMRAFAIDMGETAPSPEEAQQAVDLRIARERFWVWEEHGPKSMVSCAAPAAGVARVGPVYTPPEHRGAGYATACVLHASLLLTDRGFRCTLYTDLANPTSNAIYQRIGYAPIAEILSYEFGAT